MRFSGIIRTTFREAILLAGFRIKYIRRSIHTMERMELHVARRVIRLRHFPADPYPREGSTKRNLRELEEQSCAHSLLGIRDVSIEFAIFTDNASRLTGKINLIHITFIKINLRTTDV